MTSSFMRQPEQVDVHHMGHAAEAASQAKLKGEEQKKEQDKILLLATHAQVLTDVMGQANSAASDDTDSTENSALEQDLANWEAAQALYKEDKERLEALVKMLENMKNKMFGIQEVMNGIMNVQGDQVSSLSSIDNIDSDLRSTLTTGQSSINGNSTTDAENLLKTVSEVEAFLKQEQAQGKNSVISQASITSLQNALNSVTQQFGKDWGNTTKMAADLKNWQGEAASGKTSPQLTGLQNGFQILTQSVSALSTTTNTNLQFKTQQFQQVLGIDNSTLQAIVKSRAAEINNQRSN